MSIRPSYCIKRLRYQRGVATYNAYALLVECSFHVVCARSRIASVIDGCWDTGGLKKMEHN